MKEFFRQEKSRLIDRVNIFWENHKSEIITSLAFFLMGMIGFGLGRLSVIIPTKTQLRLVEPVHNQQAGALPAITEGEGAVTASKSGSSYYFPWCKNSIKEENKITFSTEQEAIVAGYTLAKNCAR